MAKEKERTGLIGDGKEGRPYFQSNRHGEEKAAMSAVYAMLEFAEAGEDLDVKALISGFYGRPYGECPYFVKATLLEVLRYKDEAVGAIQPLLRKWEFNRLNKVAQAILLVAYCRYYHGEESLAKAIIIDWAVEAAKEYLAEGDYRYINAVLDKALH